jgi:replicative DNA helicase
LDIYWDTIVDVRAAEPIAVVDLTVEPHHNFVAGDTYLHNTAYAVDLAVNLAETGVPVMFFSAETGRGGIEMRLLARKSDVDSKAIRGERRDYRGEHQPLTDEELGRLETAAPELRELPIYLNYTTCNPDRILDAIDELLLRYRIPFEGPYVVMVDYLQFANTTADADMAEHQRLAKLTNEFKHITKITKQPLLLFSQLKREKENGDEDPNLNWFKGTGRIETDADVAFILTGTRTPGPVAKRQLWSVKDREGEAGWVADLTFHQAVSRFETPPKLSKAQFQQDAKSLFDEPTDADPF